MLSLLNYEKYKINKLLPLDAPLEVNMIVSFSSNSVKTNYWVLTGPKGDTTETWHCRNLTDNSMSYCYTNPNARKSFYYQGMVNHPS